MLWGSVVFALVIWAWCILRPCPSSSPRSWGCRKARSSSIRSRESCGLILFVLYIWLITKMPDIRRVFQYHWREHMSIYALEASSDLDVESARRESRFHPRCGTSFILIVAIASVILFGIADSFFPMVFGHMQSLPERLATHLLLLPFVAGASYELLKLSGRYRSNRFVRFLVAPGLWLQTMTTGVPDDGMLEVALCALKAAIAKEEPA